MAGSEPGDLGGIAFAIYSVAFPPERLPDVIALCERQATRFRDEAMRLKLSVVAPELLERLPPASG